MPSREPAASPSSSLSRDVPTWRGRLLLIIFVAAAVGGIGYAGWKWGLPGSQDSDVLAASVIRGDLSITVSERGELESAQSVQVVCEIEGGGRLVTIVTEGKKVKKGDEVARFDTDALMKSIAEQGVKCEQADGKVKSAESELEVQKNKEEGEVAKSELALKLADIDLESYGDDEGEYTVELEKRKATLELGKKELKEAEDNLSFTRGLIKKGLMQLEQERVLKLAVDGKASSVKQQEADLKVLEKFTKKRKLTELDAKAKDAGRELGRTKKSQAAATEKAAGEVTAAKKTAELEGLYLSRLNAQLEKCLVKAPEDGIVIYSNTRYWDEASHIRPGGQLHFQQPIFTLPDLNKMQVKLKIHESVVKKVIQGQTATLQIEALPNQVLHGKVVSVASVAQVEPWRGNAVKEYDAIVSIDDLPRDAGLRPNMSADVKILIKTLEDVLTVPVQAVTEWEGEHVCYVVHSSQIEKRKVKVGESNETRIQLLAGLSEGERVALDARARAAGELKKNRGKDADQPPKADVDKKKSPTEPAAVAKS
jgi:RND family efflux transporter MFP subunit